VSTVLALYAAGAAVALWRTDAPWPTRLLLATSWPLGPAAFVLTVALLVAASLVAFPVLGAVAAAGAAAWWVLS
jgi:hypothetical protein